MEVLGEIDEPLEGMVLEAKKDKRVGVMTTALVQKGIVQPGQWIVAGSTYGKIKFLYNDQNKVIKEAGPSQPVRVSLFLYLSPSTMMLIL
jgi:translation initiation factor IF-2